MIKLMMIVSLLFSVISCSLFSHPSDADLKKLFSEKRDVFLKLASMLREDENIVRITPTNIFYSEDKKTISATRLVEYREMIKEIDLPLGIHRDNKTTVRFIVSSEGFPISSSEKSFTFSTELLEPVVQSLDDVIKNDAGDTPPTFKRIEDNWFIRYESW